MGSGADVPADHGLWSRARTNYAVCNTTRDPGVRMLFRSRADRARPLRYFVYLSDKKLQMFFDQIDHKVRVALAAELKVDLKVLSLTLSSPDITRSQQEQNLLSKLAVVEGYISRYQGVGDLSAKRGYLAADLEMDWLPCDDNETVLFCGRSGSLLVVLGGSVTNLWGRPASSAQVGSHPYTIQAAVRRGVGSPELGADLDAVAGEVCRMPQPVRFLARVISRGPKPGDDGEYLLATPLFVEATDSEVAG
jgi:hypothetical protein